MNARLSLFWNCNDDILKCNFCSSFGLLYWTMYCHSERADLDHQLILFFIRTSRTVIFFCAPVNWLRHWHLCICSFSNVGTFSTQTTHSMHTVVTYFWLFWEFECFLCAGLSLESSAGRGYPPLRGCCGGCVVVMSSWGRQRLRTLWRTPPRSAYNRFIIEVFLKRKNYKCYTMTYDH